MKSTLLASAAAILLLGCANTPPSAPDGTGGSGTPGTGGTTATGGETGTGGAPSTGGTPGTGGITPGTGGTGTGGVVGTGGTGTGGSSTGGHGGTAGGSSGGSGGAGGKSTGGAAGSSATGGAGGGGDLLSVAASLDGQLVKFPCGDATQNDGYDCANVGCTNNAVTHTTTYQMAGDSATTYAVTFNVRGVVEAYAYVGGTRAGGTASISTGGSLFCSGGTQEPSGNGNDYNTYELDVSPAVTGETNVYYLNSVISSENPHTSSTTQHLTFPINYSATIKVKGGGTITFKSYDSNCRSVQNCGPTQGNKCQAPRTVSLAGVTPAAPTDFSQPFQAPTGFYGQWVYFDVTGVTVAQ
jgi:hypothetical protein